MAQIDLTILGSTGSIGRQALDIAAKRPDEIRVTALSANRSVDQLVRQAKSFGVRYLAIADESMRDHPALDLLDDGVEVCFGPDAVVDLASANPMSQPSGQDMVLNAMVGVAGLRASYACLAAGRRLALANKESLVVGGEILMKMTSPDQLIPVDSEHSAIFQCLLGEFESCVERIWITASGGPFRGKTRKELTEVTVEDALAHPTWTMGPKITIDSSTLMNKGLEVIEAYHLFCCDFDHITVVVHPQSCIHSMVEYTDGSIKAHLGTSDMRIPIQFALSYPKRWEAPLKAIDFRQLGDLTFEEPDTSTFGCLDLAIAAGREGGTAPAVLNAANEVAVAAFLDRRCAYLDIEQTVEQTLKAHRGEKVESIDQLLEHDLWARSKAGEILLKLGGSL